MAELSEKELLFLSNLMYFQKDQINEGMTVGEIIEIAMNNSNAKNKGGVDYKELKEMCEIAKQDKSLCKLKVEKTTSLTSDINAACFVDSKGEATVAFMGTGGTSAAWIDNVYGLDLPDTVCQKQAADFINDVSRRHKNITVTGHSKGGNLAMYTTIVCGDKIDRCVAFDAQGFDNEFYHLHGVDSLKNAHKITNIRASNDYVSPLLTQPVGSKQLIVSNSRSRGKGIKSGHYSTLLFLSNVKDVNDLKGNFKFTDLRPPSPIMLIVDGLSNGVQVVSNTVPGLGFLLTVFGGTILAGLMGDDGGFDLGAIYDRFATLTKKYLANKHKYSQAEYTINLRAIKSCVDEMNTSYNSYNSKIAELDEIHSAIKPTAPSLAVNKFLVGRIKSNCETINRRFGQLKDALNAIADSYSRAETSLIQVINADCPVG